MEYGDLEREVSRLREEKYPTARVRDLTSGPRAS